jgi:uncharacterized protein YndB with AHSA1/START domain
MTNPETKGRLVEAATEIDAPAEHVWKALTDAAEITRWFATDAKIEPRVGGVWSLNWYGDFPWDARIQIFEPNRHLRIAMEAPPPTSEDVGKPESEHARPTIVDYLLEARGGKTVLRIVHSGFGADAAWDEEYEGVRTGWAFEIEVLRHYVENHRGRNRSMFWLRVPVEGSHEHAWNRLADLAPEIARRRFKPGELATLQLATGERISGSVVTHEAPRAFGMIAEDSSIFRLAVDLCGGTLEAGVWIEAWGESAALVEDHKRRWSAALAKAFPGANVKGAAAA